LINVVNEDLGFSGESPVMWLVLLYSRLEGRGFESHPMLDDNGVKAMSGSISEPNPDSLINGKGIRNMGS